VSCTSHAWCGVVLVVLVFGCGRPLPSAGLSGGPNSGSESDDENDNSDDETNSSSDDGQDSDNATETGPPPSSPPEPVQLSAGDIHVCGLWAEHGVRCWGEGWSGQLGLGQYGNQPTPQPVIGLATGVLHVSAGWRHSCAALDSGVATCWGQSIGGTLLAPAEVSGLDVPIVRVSSGGDIVSCALTEDRSLRCWGENFAGLLGDGTTEDSSAAVPVLELDEVVDFAIGFEHACAVESDGQVYCWGRNWNGMVDSLAPESDMYLTPQVKTGLGHITAVSAGYYNSCALHADGHVSCWGSEDYGQLGDGSGTAHGDPEPVAGLVDAVAITGQSRNNCALRSGGGIVCWGYNAFGQLGDQTTEDRATPVAVYGIDDATQVVSGSTFTCAYSQQLGPLCWGSNQHGQLGDGGFGDSLVPVPVLAPS
jgi:alpha-tubulin suppressor-like RCC1 family protein